MPNINLPVQVSLMKAADDARGCMPVKKAYPPWARNSTMTRALVAVQDAQELQTDQSSSDSKYPRNKPAAIVY